MLCKRLCGSDVAVPIQLPSSDAVAKSMVKPQEGRASERCAEICA